MSMSSSSAFDDPVIENLLQGLSNDVDDLDASLDRFTRERLAALQNQKQALANYDKEMQEIEDQEFFGLKRWEAMQEQQSKPVVDHNILKHLNIDRQAEYQQSVEEFDRNEREKEKAKTLDYSSMLGELKKKKLPDLASDNHPPPTFEEKKKLRENMFNFFEESTIEETRLELEIDKARENNDSRLVEELSEALFLLQKMHGEKLNSMIGGYKPQMFSRSWGRDPDYVRLSKELNNIAETYNTTDIEISLRK